MRDPTSLFIARDDRFGYVELATGRYTSPCVSPPKGDPPPSPADFIELERHKGVTRVRFAVELRFDLASGKVDESQHAAIAHGVRPAETSE